MPYLAQELHQELAILGSKRRSFLRKRNSQDSFLDQQNKIDDIFQNQFTHLDKNLIEISPELASTMLIIMHLRDTFHGILQSRRAILFDIVLYLDDKAKTQVYITHEKTLIDLLFRCIV